MNKSKYSDAYETGKTARFYVENAVAYINNAIQASKHPGSMKTKDGVRTFNENSALVSIDEGMAALARMKVLLLAAINKRSK